MKPAYSCKYSKTVVTLLGHTRLPEFRPDNDGMYGVSCRYSIAWSKNGLNILTIYNKNILFCILDSHLIG